MVEGVCARGCGCLGEEQFSDDGRDSCPLAVLQRLSHAPIRLLCAAHRRPHLEHPRSMIALC